MEGTWIPEGGSNAPSQRNVWLHILVIQRLPLNHNGLSTLGESKYYVKIADYIGALGIDKDAQEELND